MRPTAGELSERLGRLPGIEALVGALEGLPPTYLVGGAVRDLLRGAEAVDLDLAVEGDGVAVAAALAERLGGEAVAHERFGTAAVTSPAVSFDIATTRREVYEQPGALPAVSEAPLDEDLGRRDFSINAMALTLTAGAAGGDFGMLHDPHGGDDDLQARRIRVLHDGSFIDDPTRLLRAVRYETRLGFALDAATERLARAASEDGALRVVSGPRVRDELLDLLAEQEVAAALGRVRELGLDTALDPNLAADADLVASAALGAVETGADRVLAALAALISAAPAELDPWLMRLDLKAPQRAAVARAARSGPTLAAELGSPLPDSRLHALLDDEPPEALALALASGAPADPVLRYLSALRDTRLEITGDDLVAAGVGPSPAIGQALAETLRRKLDGEVAGREAELALALRLAREHETEAGGGR